MLNHSGLSNLCTLIAHNYKFFNDTFDHLILLDLCLKFKKGFNYKSLTCLIKNRYFRDLKELITDFEFHRSSIEYRKNRQAIDFSRSFSGNDFVFFLSGEENCFLSEPLDNHDYLNSKLMILPDISDEREYHYSFKKEGKARGKPISEEAVIQLLSSMTWDDIDEDSIDINFFDFVHPLEGIGFNDITPEQEEELKESKLFISKNRNEINDKIEDYIIAKFEFLDINHLNRPFVIKEAIDDLFNEYSELSKGKRDREGKEKESGFEACKVRWFDKLDNILDLECSQESISYIGRMLSFMGGVSKENAGDQVWGKHMDYLKLLKKVCKREKESFDKKEKMSAKEYEKMIKTMKAKRCQIMLDIKSLYPKYTYIQDELLCRDTEVLKSVDLCEFIPSGLSYYKSLYELKNMSEEMPDRSISASRLGVSENDKKIRKLKILPADEAEFIARDIFKDKVIRYDNIKDRVKSLMGDEWVDNIEESYFKASSEVKIKDLNEDLKKMKDEYNSLIKTRKNWDDMDRDHFLVNLQNIFVLDDDFDKYLSVRLKKEVIESVKIMSKKIPELIKTSLRNPKYIVNATVMKSISEDNKAKIERINNAINRAQDFLESFITVDKDTDRGRTRKGGVKIKEVGESSKSNKKSKKKAVDTEEEAKRDWESNKVLRSIELKKAVSDFREIYVHLNETINLSPEKLKIENAYCHCDHGKSDEVHNLHYKNILMKSFNKFQVGHSGLRESKNKLDHCEKRVEALQKQRRDYLDYKKKEEEERIKNEIAYRDYVLEKEIEKRKTLMIANIKELGKGKEKKRMLWEEYRSDIDKRVKDWNKKLLEANKEMIVIKKKYKDHEENLNECNLVYLYLTNQIKEIKAELSKIEKTAHKKKVEWEKWQKTKGKKVVKEEKTKGLNIYSILDPDTSETEESDKNESEISPVKFSFDEEIQIESLCNQLSSRTEKRLKIKLEMEEIKKKIERGEPMEDEKTELVEEINRYTILYKDKNRLAEAEELADNFMSNSENLKIAANLPMQKAKSRRVREMIAEREYEYGVCDKSATRAINECLGSHYIKKYNVRDFRSILILLALCYNNKIQADYSYIKQKFGMKRCQTKFLLKGIVLSLNKLNKNILYIQDKKAQI